MIVAASFQALSMLAYCDGPARTVFVNELEDRDNETDMTSTIWP